MKNIHDVAKKFANILDEPIPPTLRSGPHFEPVSQTRPIQDINKSVHFLKEHLRWLFKYAHNEMYKEALEVSTKMTEEMKKVDNFLLSKIGQDEIKANNG